jgi:hypothetical protein
VLGDRPLVAETPEHLLDDDVTPTAKKPRRLASTLRPKTTASARSGSSR